jgi:hypothetical protein
VPSLTARFERDQIVKEGAQLGVVLQSGGVSYDVLWVGGGTSRYRYDAGRAVSVATAFDLQYQEGTIVHLRAEAEAAHRERRRGAGVRRGQVHPSR